MQAAHKEKVAEYRAEAAAAEEAKRKKADEDRAFADEMRKKRGD